MFKKMICIGMLLVMALSFAACDNGDYGEKPVDLDDPMPEIWEHEWDWNLALSYDGVTYIDIDYAKEFTIGADVTIICLLMWKNYENLENIYVEEGNPVFASEDGVLYSKSFETLYKWPSKKPVTQPKDTIKYFARMCFAYCDMPEDFELPDGTISIGHRAFYNSNLTQLHIKENVKTASGGFPLTLKRIEISTPIVYASFFDAWYAETVIFHEGVRQLRGTLWLKSQSAKNNEAFLFRIQEVEFPGTLEAIGEVFFPANITVKKYTIPNNVKFIDEFAFFDYNYFHYEHFEHEIDWPETNHITKFDCKSNYARKRIAKIKKEWGEMAYTIITD